MEGRTCAGLWVTGTGKDGRPRRTYLYHVSDNADTMRDYDAQCVVWQTALNPVIALELLSTGAWSGVGVLGPEAFDAHAFLELMRAPESDGGYGQAWGLEDRLVPLIS
jgi:saccharopine dehydrogenase-like NADP-dependent oxidoreductase